MRERIGIAAEEIALPAGLATVSELIAWLKGRGPGYQAAFADPALIRCAIDQEFAAPDARIAGAREIGFFPPVTGG
jgi:molybdopterin synthase sulfur carrier subunit